MGRIKAPVVTCYFSANAKYILDIPLSIRWEVRGDYMNGAVKFYLFQFTLIIITAFLFWKLVNIGTS